MDKRKENPKPFHKFIWSILSAEKQVVSLQSSYGRVIEKED